jgi:hypothetical protein
LEGPATCRPAPFDLFLGAVNGKPYPALVSPGEAAEQRRNGNLYQSARQQAWVAVGDRFVRIMHKPAIFGTIMERKIWQRF